jgi:hypothetical protein
MLESSIGYQLNGAIRVREITYVKGTFISSSYFAYAGLSDKDLLIGSKLCK